MHLRKNWNFRPINSCFKFVFHLLLFFIVMMMTSRFNFSLSTSLDFNFASHFNSNFGLSIDFWARF